MKKMYTVLAVIGVLFISLGVIITVNNNVMALSKEDMTTLNLKRIGNYSRPKNYTSAQASVITDKYLVSIFLDNSDDSKGKNAILVLDKNTLKKVELDTNPITKYNLGHANDATYNNNTKEILVIDNDKIHVLDSETFELKEDKTLDKKYHAIGYDSDSNQYILASKTDNGTRFHIVNTEFQEMSSFDIQTSLTRQGMTIHNGYIYYACSEAGKVTKYQSKYDGVLKAGENLIYVYDLKGNNKNVFYIPYAYRGIKYNSLQSVDFDGDRMITSFNQNTKVGYFTPEYNSNITKTFKVSIDNQNIVTNNGGFEASISQNNKVLSKVKNKELYYPFKLKFNKIGNYKYIIKQTNMKDNKIKYDEDEKTLEVNVTYDPTVNSLVASSNVKDITFTNTYKEKESTDKEEEKVEVKEENDGETVNIKEEKDEETVDIKEEKKEETVEIPEEKKEETKKKTTNNNKEKKDSKEEKKDSKEDNKEEETKKEEEPVIVDVPDTGSKSYLYIIGVVILGFNAWYIKKKANC